MAEIHSVAIHPAIGIARVGNSPGGHFVGPEIPGVAALPDGGFKDAEGPAGRMKRQAARFRVFAYDAEGNPVGELTTADARIEWTVQVANAKAEWDTFDGATGEDLPLGKRRPGRFRRNRDVAGEARAELIIAPPAVTLEGARRRAAFEGGSFLGIAVGLGEARTDAHGRLLVLGGAGRSGSSEQGRLVTHYANNDRWFDDVSDGPVRARVTLPDGRTLDAKPAWVICGPPDFAPEVAHPVTLYDVALDVAVRAGRLPEPDRPSFTHDILPLLQRAPGLAWTSDAARRGHPAGAGWMDWSRLADAGAASEGARRAVLASMRDPNATGDEAVRQATARYMPALAGDAGDPVEGDPSKWMSVTRTQHAALRRWAAGDFVEDWTGAPALAGAGVTPGGLDRAALEACSGGPFYPGIECGWLLRKPEAYMEPFRLDPAVLKAGDVTKQMAVPWQADFYECSTHWWPGQRPDEVLPQAAYERIAEIDAELANPRLGTDGSDGAVRADLGRERAELIARRVPWARGLPDASPAGDNAMVEAWSRLGFVTSVSPGGEPFEIDRAPALVEVERGTVAATLDLREAFHKLVNIEAHPDFRPAARALAERFLGAADYAADRFYAPFPYSVEAFRARIDAIYQAYVADMDEPHWLEEHSREAVVENLRQKAPMNLVDGAWLHHVLSAGPTDEVKAKLFSIWADEAGNGETELNHSNVYDGLLRSLDVYLPPIGSRAFVELDLLPGAWENPVFQLAVGLCPQEFLPELLGMTLYLEWEATPTMLPIVRMLEHHRIDPQFYRMHMAIDNVTAGHGALAREAIELYLDTARASGGETAVQEQWRRIWRGYVAWATLGSLGKELGPLMDKIDRRGEHADGRAFARERMIALVRAKAPYARSAHGAKQLGGRSLGALFADPDALLDTLVATGWVDPASPRDSRLVTELLGFHGPMYKVFSATELDVLLDWIGSLADHGAPAPGPASSAERVAAVIERHRADAAGEPGHGRDTLPDGQGAERSVREWFADGDVPAIMKALARSRFVTPGDPAASSLIHEVFGGRMAGVLAPGEVHAFTDWIAEGCPEPGAARAGLSRAGALRGLHGGRSWDDRREPSFIERRRLIGAGAVH